MATLLNVYATVRQLPEPAFEHVQRGRRDRSDPELAPHLNGFMGFVMGGGERSMTSARYHVLRHLERVRHHLSLEVEDAQLDALANWAEQANAILFLPDGTVRDPSGRVLVDAESGDAAPGAAVPFPPDAVERKQRHERRLTKHRIPIAAGLPPVVGRDEVELREPGVVATRALALLAVALRAESIASGDPLTPAELEQRLPQAFEAFSPREEAFMASPTPDKQAVIDHAWRYEAVWLLEWALGWVDELGDGDTICDVGRTVGTVLDADRERLVADATLRSTSEILNALDLHLRMHWAVREAAQHGVSPPAGLDPGVLQERRHALNWLVCFEDADWDDVTTPT